MKDFLSFTKRISKQSINLMLKYFFVGIFWIVITVIANKFELHELTYFNAVFQIMILLSFIPFGIVSGLSVYVNQNIDDKEAIKKYIKLGFMMVFLLVAIFILLLLIFKDFVFKYLIVAEITDNYIFLYMMIPVMLLVIVCDYFSDVLKILRELKNNLFFSLIDFGTTLGAILIVAYLGYLSLYSIAICYIVTKLVFVPAYLVYMFKKSTKIVQLDLLKMHKIKVKFNFSIIKKIYSFGLNEVLWNIAFTISMLSLLKNSELLYNSYLYYENTLNIINGVYFGLLTMCGISVCNHLGKSNIEAAYKESIYSIILTVLLWVGIFSLCIIFKEFIVSGMNVDIIETGMEIFYLYMFMQLIRFINWTFNTYILPQGGEVKFLLQLQVLELIYFIGLFIALSFFEVNPITTIWLISATTIFQNIIYIFYFKSKKWMVNLKGVSV